MVVWGLERQHSKVFAGQAQGREFESKPGSVAHTVAAELGRQRQEGLWNSLESN